MKDHARQARLKAALRENLKRRRAQGRERATDTVTTSGTAAAEPPASVAAPDAPPEGREAAGAHKAADGPP